VTGPDVQVALIGCGAAGEWYHLPALRAVLARDRIWFVDADLERALDLARSVGRPERAAADYREVADDVQAAVIALPNHLHGVVAEDLLRRGVHVLCEKPLTTSVHEAERVLAAAADGSAVLAVGHFRRFFPSVELVCDLLRRRLCGEPVRFVAEEGYVFAWSSRSGYWLDPDQAGGGVLADLGVHVLDELRTFFGELEIAAYRDDAHGGVEADCVVEVGGPVPGTIELSRTRSLSGLIRVECESGAIEAPLASPGVVRLTVDGRTHELSAGSPADGYGPAFRAQLEDFLAAIDGGREPRVSGTDGAALVRLIEACYRGRQPLPEPWVFETLFRS